MPSICPRARGVGLIEPELASVTTNRMDELPQLSAKTFMGHLWLSDSKPGIPIVYAKAIPSLQEDLSKTLLDEIRAKGVLPV